jgi:hypothetical protein
MKSPIRTRLARFLTLAPAALVLNVAAAAGANSTDDLLEQQRVILSGRVAMVSHPAVAPAAEAGSKTEPLELTRRVLSGIPVQAREPRRTQTREAFRRHAEDDVQAWAQHVLAGHPYAVVKS